MSDLKEHEKLVERYVREGNTQEAINSLLFLITKYAQQGDFDMAAAMQDRITVIDPLALSEYIQGQKIIATCKSNPTGGGHMLLWSGFYSRLDQYDAQNLYNIMEKASFRPGEVILQEGEINRNLYFLDSGYAKHIYTRNRREIFIKRIKAGDIAGEENFFDTSCCTTTLVAMNQVKAHSLSAERLQAEAASYETIIKELSVFCAEGVKLEQLLRSNAQDRRRHKRISIHGSILIKPAEQHTSDNLRGELRDVSIGGISFYMQVARKEHVQMLLGQKLKLKFNIPPHMGKIEKVGQVMSIRLCGPSPGGEKRYSIHIQFDSPLAENSITEAARHLKMVKPT